MQNSFLCEAASIIKSKYVYARAGDNPLPGWDSVEDGSEVVLAETEENFGGEMFQLNDQLVLTRQVQKL